MAKRGAGPLRALVVAGVLLLVLALVARRTPTQGLTDEAADPLAGVASPADRGTLRVDRAVKEYDFVEAYVRYSNTTTRTFSRSVQVGCDAVDRGGRVVGTNARSFFARERGPIAPGFEGTLKIPIAVGSAAYKDVRCEIQSAL